jgi:hypothetical protein
MSIIKLITPEALAFDQPIMQLVKMASTGFGGSDRRMFEKRASVDLIRSVGDLREKIASDEILVHLFAMGSTEDYGPNRNGDGFRRVTCQNYHPTFVKHAMFYRNHANKDPRRSYGRVIKSAWHDPMKRIELLVALNGTKQAAARNGGLIADLEMEKLASGKEIPVSMACMVPFDECSYCHNKAATGEDYCTGTNQGGRCKAGGLRDNMGALVEIDGGIHHLHADNPNPKFFDISNVFRPADRIAYVTGVLEKNAAATGRIIKSAELARELGITVPAAVLLEGNYPRHVERMIKLAYQLADIENDLVSNGANNNYNMAFRETVQQADRALELPPEPRRKFATVLRALSDARICLPVRQFVELTAEQSFEKAAEIAAVVTSRLPGIYNRLTTGGELADKISQSQFSPTDAQAPPQYAGWATKLAEDFSLGRNHVERRVFRASLRGESPVTNWQQTKIASDNGPIEKMAEQYALYQLSFLGALPEHDPDLPLTTSLVIAQNYA